MENVTSQTQADTTVAPAVSPQPPIAPGATQESLQGDTSAPAANIVNHPFGMGTGAPAGVPDSAAPRQDGLKAPVAPGTGPIPAPTGPGPVPLGFNEFAATSAAVFEMLAVNGPAAAQRLQDWIKRERSIAYAHGK
jgi:hypothetical protein